MDRPLQQSDGLRRRPPPAARRWRASVGATFAVLLLLPLLVVATPVTAGAAGDGVTNFTGTGISGPDGIAWGPDGNLWFTEQEGNINGRITPQGMFTEFSVPGSVFPSSGITTGPDHALWFTDFLGNDVGRAAIPVTASVTISAASLPAGQIGFSYLTALSASGGTAPYSNWTVVSGSLPTGLTLAPSTGGISGIPTGVASGAFSFSVTVQDSTGVTSPAQSFSIGELLRTL